MTEPAPIALYVHWPFCAAKCPYCDFNSHVRETVDQQRWRAALLAELAHWAEQVGPRSLSSLFFGGGTPSLMPSETVAAVIDAAKAHFPPLPSCEITLEANPGSVEAGRFRAYHQAGVGRVSVGVQALNDPDLKALGRLHSVAEARAALDVAASTFPRWSLDLIYARTGQTPADWRAELTEALAIATGGHLSLYQLTIEPGTQFATLYNRGALTIPEDDDAIEMYEITQDLCGAAGLPAYEVSNHASPGQESRHNLTYWRYQDYIGIGPGAHGRLVLQGHKQATRTHRAPEIWLERVEQHGHAGHATVLIPPEDRWQEALLMGLRLSEGLPLGRLSSEAGTDWQDLISADRVTMACEEGLLTASDTHLTATATGRQRLNALIAFLAS
ncbi:MAG: radical SAM family heme chaperone HemW [Alphaproteobacteria bacterium]